MKSAGLSYPKIKSDLFFTITFIRPKYSLKAEGGQEKVVRKGGQKEWSKPTEKQKRVLDVIKENPEISRKELSAKLNINESAIQKHIKNLKEKGILKRIASPTKGGYWEVMD